MNAQIKQLVELAYEYADIDMTEIGEDIEGVAYALKIYEEGYLEGIIPDLERLKAITARMLLTMIEHDLDHYIGANPEINDDGERMRWLLHNQWKLAAAEKAIYVFRRNYS